MESTLSRPRPGRQSAGSTLRPRGGAKAAAEEATGVSGPPLAARYRDSGGLPSGEGACGASWASQALASASVFAVVPPADDGCRDAVDGVFVDLEPAGQGLHRVFERHRQGHRDVVAVFAVRIRILIDVDVIGRCADPGRVDLAHGPAFDQAPGEDAGGPVGLIQFQPQALSGRFRPVLEIRSLSHLRARFPRCLGRPRGGGPLSRPVLGTRARCQAGAGVRRGRRPGRSAGRGSLRPLPVAPPALAGAALPANPATGRRGRRSWPSSVPPCRFPQIPRSDHGFSGKQARNGRFTPCGFRGGRPGGRAGPFLNNPSVSYTIRATKGVT